MPIRPELRELYPSDWVEISRKIRFERAGGVCQSCGRPHGLRVRCLPDGRWFDVACHTWRNCRGRPARWPDLVETAQIRHTRVVLAAAHLDHDPRNNRLRNLRSLCQRCHMIHDRPHHLAQRRITYLLRRALGDLFLGPYSVYFALRAPGSEVKVRRLLGWADDVMVEPHPSRRRAGARAISASQYRMIASGWRERGKRADQASRIAPKAPFWEFEPEVFPPPWSSD